MKNHLQGCVQVARHQIGLKGSFFLLFEEWSAISQIFVMEKIIKFSGPAAQFKRIFGNLHAQPSIHKSLIRPFMSAAPLQNNGFFFPPWSHYEPSLDDFDHHHHEPNCVIWLSGRGRIRQRNKSSEDIKDSLNWPITDASLWWTSFKASGFKSQELILESHNKRAEQQSNLKFYWDSSHRVIAEKKVRVHRASILPTRSTDHFQDLVAT